MNHATTIFRTSGLLRVWLTVLQVFSAVFGTLAALLLLILGGALLAGVTLPASVQNDLGTLPQASLAVIGGLLLLCGLLYAAFVVVYLLLIGWCKEWEGQVARLSTSQGGNVARVAALSRTLGGWITASQWAPVIIYALLLIGVVAGASWLSALFAATTPNASPQDVRFIGPLLGGIYAFGILIGGGSQAVVNWLVLAAIRRFMNATTQRLRGMNMPITPSANTVGTWFIVLMVLVGLGGGTILLYIPLLALALVGTSQDSQAAADLGLGLGSSALSLLFSLASYVLMFLLLLWSRAYALAVAAQLDSGLTPANATLPGQAPVEGTPYGSAPLN